MPNLSIYIPFSRSRGLLLRLVAVLIRPDRPTRPVQRGRAHVPKCLRQDVGLLPEAEHPPRLSPTGSRSDGL